MKKSFPLAGLTLVELLIGIVVGLVVLSAAGGGVMSYLRSHSENQKILNLNQSMRSAMDIMAREIERAGYVTDDIANSSSLKANPFLVGDCDLSICGSTEKTGSCINFSYNKDSDLVVDSGESSGFKITNDYAVMMKTSGGSSCGWVDGERITDEKEIEITDLNFIINEQEVNISRPATLGCFVGDYCIFVRSVTIEMSGGIKGDVSSPPIIQSIKQTVKIRNDKFFQKSS